MTSEGMRKMQEAIDLLHEELDEAEKMGARQLSQEMVIVITIAGDVCREREEAEVTVRHLREALRRLGYAQEA